MKLASIQMAVFEGDKARAIDEASKRIRQAKGADLVILPELWNIGFMSFERYIPEAEDREGPTLTTMRELAVEIKAHIHMGSFVERQEGRYYNSSYLISPTGDILANYRKIHLFGYQSREGELLTPGDETVVVDTPLARFGMATCYDLRFPELFRRMVDLGAQIFLVCSAWPYPRLEHWIMLNRVRALENQCFLVSANSVGPNLGGLFVGHSMAVDPWGIILASAGDDEAIVKAEIDMEILHEARRRFPVLTDRVDWLNPFGTQRKG
jgi:predicted amidohydrolase